MIILQVSVTNVSLSFNTFKVLELPARVSDFFKIYYSPPGRLSAGTGVNIEGTFINPFINHFIIIFIIFMLLLL